MVLMSTRIKLWQTGPGTEKAYPFSTLPQSDPNKRHVWVPKSVIYHISRDPHKPTEWAPCVVEIEDWFAEKENL